MKFKRTLAFCLCLLVAVVSAFVLLPVEKAHAATVCPAEDHDNVHISAVCTVHVLGLGEDEFGIYSICMFCGRKWYT